MSKKNNLAIPAYVKDAVKKLLSLGFEAYVVGGSVRDLLLNKPPKDFDIATNATPYEIKKNFRNSIIIGRRFKLVHLIFHKDIVEVATFRTSGIDLEHHPETGMIMRDNTYGTLENDSWRRDFTINSLYYDVKTEEIIDYTGGLQDLENKTIKIIGDPNTRYAEDPVRMLRALRFIARLDFILEDNTAKAIKDNAYLICQTSSARLFDEYMKLFLHGFAYKVYYLLQDYNILQYLFPQMHNALSDGNIKNFIDTALKNTDDRIINNKPLNPGFLLAVFLWPTFIKNRNALLALKINPSEATEKAVNKTLSEQIKTLAIPRRFTMTIREIWLLQFRFNNRAGKRAYNLLAHAKFRAAYDFLILRLEIGDVDEALCKWWTKFQVACEKEKIEMVKEFSKTHRKKSK